VPVDGSTLTESAIELATQLAAADTTLVLTRVVEPVEIAATSGVEAVAVVDWRSTEELTAEAEQYLARLAEALTRSGIRTESVVRTGRTASELRNVASERGVDLIVMSTHDRSGFDRVVLGSVADDLARHANQPVLLVSARALTAHMMDPFVVRDVMVRDVAAVTEDEALTSVVRKLLRRRVSGAPVVNAQGALVGVISEHDLIEWHSRFIAETGRNEALLDPKVYRDRLDTETVRSIMSTDLISIESDAQLAAAAHLLVEHRLRRLPVTHAGRLVGIITRSDVLGAIERRETGVIAATSTS
jgi:nucleotide-binding universal stress UspA family protein/predicted transcriptional regulator